MNIEKLIHYRVLLGFFGTFFGWLCTMFGASFVYLIKDIKDKAQEKKLDIINSISLGSTSGIMLAASFWSLLIPGIQIAKEHHLNIYIMAIGGFLFGGLIVFIMDKTIPHLHLNTERGFAEGISKEKFSSLALMVFAVTLHNLPEGMSVGVVFGALGDPNIKLSDGISIALGIGIQNIPEGFALSIPLWQSGMSRWKAFSIGQLSAIIEPIGGTLGALFSSKTIVILPFVLSAAAGAMIYIIVEELIPESQAKNGSDLGTIGLFLGFALMTFLDLYFG